MHFLISNFRWLLLGYFNRKIYRAVTSSVFTGIFHLKVTSVKKKKKSNIYRDNLRKIKIPSISSRLRR